MRPLPLVAAALALAACSSGARPPANEAVVSQVQAAAFSNGLSASIDQNYRIGPSDKLRITVFQVPDLSFEEIYVDASGNLQMPLIGTVYAAGKTPAELSNSLQTLLASRYIRNPQVTVIVTAAASQKVTVDGAVTKPGVYVMQGRTTLMQAVAMAEGPTRTANLSSVAVFRNNEGRRMVAIFDLAAIRNGQASDPILNGDDMIVVDTSGLSANVREVLQALPGLAVFAYF